jgi:hypothetical protein
VRVFIEPYGEVLSVWPMLQSGQVSLYIPEDDYWFSWVSVVC